MQLPLNLNSEMRMHDGHPRGFGVLREMRFDHSPDFDRPDPKSPEASTRVKNGMIPGSMSKSYYAQTRSKSMQKQLEYTNAADKENMNTFNQMSKETTPFLNKQSLMQYSPVSASNLPGVQEQTDILDYSVRLAEIFARMSNLIVLSSDENRDEAIIELKSLKQHADLIKIQLEKVHELKNSLNSSGYPSDRSNPVSQLVRTIESSLVFSWFPKSEFEGLDSLPNDSGKHLEVKLEHAHLNARGLTISPLEKLRHVVSIHSYTELERTVVQGRVQGIEALIQDFAEANLQSEKTVHVELYDHRKTRC